MNFFSKKWKNENFKLRKKVEKMKIFFEKMGKMKFVFEKREKKMKFFSKLRKTTEIFLQNSKIHILLKIAFKRHFLFTFFVGKNSLVIGKKPVSMANFFHE